MTIEEFRWSTAQFKEWRNENNNCIRELGFFSWWREPDYRDDYRELWEIENALSSPGRAQRFELLSIWRLARDESYAEWVATLPPKTCQISFAGMEENTDWFVRRKGAFHDNLLATERLIRAGIAPRWQLFVTKRCLDETDEFLRLIKDMRITERCEEIGMKFEVFLNSFSPEGNGYEIEDIRIDKNDLPFISTELIFISRDGLKLFGEPEYKLMEDMINDKNPPNLTPNILSLAVDADYDVYPNNAEPAGWWRLGNLKLDGVDAVMKAYRDGTPPGMQANSKMPISELARLYGSQSGNKLYEKSDLLARWLHQWGTDYKRWVYNYAKQK